MLKHITNELFIYTKLLAGGSLLDILETATLVERCTVPRHNTRNEEGGRMFDFLNHSLPEGGLCGYKIVGCLIISSV